MLSVLLINYLSEIHGRVCFYYIYTIVYVSILFTKVSDSKSKYCVARPSLSSDSLAIMTHVRIGYHFEYISAFKFLIGV